MYAKLSQKPNPLPEIQEADDLSSLAKYTAEEIRREPSLLAFIVLQQQGTLGALI